MKTSIYSLLLMCLLIIQSNGFTQSLGAFSNVLTQNTVLTGATVDHRACQEIRLLPGYRYKALGNSSMSAKIDPYLTCQIDYSSELINSNELPLLNTNLEVGTTEGHFDVTHGGAAVYSIPLLLPLGTNGMQPNLSINYNSQANDGLLGYGWNLSGLSSISRAGSVPYFDDAIRSVKCTNEDNFMLDGQRLFELTGPNGGNNTIYGTEIESYSIITSHGVSGNGPQYFTIETKDGIRMEYGNSADSRIEVQGGTTIFTWLLNKVTDLYGNYYSITYKEINNDYGVEYYPDIIEYTGNINSDLVPYNKIRFVYGQRNDPSRIFAAGMSIINNRIIESIEIFSDQTKFKEYKFNYSFHHWSILTEINEIVLNNETYNPIRLSYDDLTFDAPYEIENVTINEDLPTTVQSSVTGLKTATLDFNADGIDDIIRLFGSSITDEYTWELLNKTTNEITTGSTPVFNALLDHQRDDFTVDFNGDGYEDLLLYQGITPLLNGDFRDPVFHFMISNKVNGFNISSPISFENLPSESSDFKFLVGDFDGDAATDLFIYFYNLDKGYIYFFRTATEILALDADIGNETLSFFTTDFNGDGKNEIFYTFTNPNANSSYSSILEYTNGALASTSGVLTFPTGYHKVFTGDFNGDSKTDLLTWNSNSNWEIAYSKGLNNGFTTTAITIPGNPNESEFSYDIIDLNGDNKSDIFIHVSFNNQIMFSQLFYSKSVGVHNAPIFLAYNNGILYKGLQYGTYDGSGDLISYMNSGGVLKKIRFFNTSNRAKCTNIRNGLGYNIKIKYSSLLELTLSGGYTKLNDANYPFIDKTLPLIVVRKLQKDNTIGSLNTFLYDYKGLKTHMLGKGLLGFSQFNSLSEDFSIKNEFVYTFTNSNFVQPTLVESRTISTLNNSLISRTNYAYDFSSNLLQGNPNNKRYRFYPESAISYDYVNGNTTTNQTTIDLSGNVIQQISNNGAETVQKSFTYSSSCTNFPFSNRLLSIQTTLTRSGEVPFTRSTTFEYGGIACSMTKKILDTGVEIIHERNSFGNVTSETTDSPNDELPPSQTTYLFEERGRFPVSIANALQHTTNIIYNQFWGKPIQVTDPNGLTTLSTYDGFGRLVSATSPTGVVTNTIRNWEINSQLNSVFSITETTEGLSYEKTFYSSIGMPIKTETQGFDGAILASRNVYNELNQLETVVDLNNNLSTTYSYEPLLQRPNSVLKPDGSHISFGYDMNKKITTSYQSGTVKTLQEHYDASGKLIEIVDDGGSITYTYFSSGNPKSISTPGNTSVNMIYDVFGRQRQLIDPAAGTMTYSYDDFDRLTSQTDANQQSTMLTYDVLGRIIKKEYTSGAIINYEYDPEGSLGMLKKIELIPGSNDGFVAYTKEFVYDEYQRLIEESEQFDNKNLIHSFEYDQLGRVVKQIYPGGFTIRQAFNEYGYLQKITDVNHNNLWECNSLTNMLQPESSVYGDGLQIQFSYGDFGELTQKQGMSLGSNLSTLLFRQNYGFDTQSGNLSSRGKTNPSLEEIFEYDNLDRLTRVLDGNLQAVNVVNYVTSNNGNILSKSDAGDFFYNSTRPHALSVIRDPQPSVSTDLQQISYTSYNQPLLLEEGQFKLKYQYNPDEQRCISQLYDNQDNLVKKIIYKGNYEVIEAGSDIYELSYLNSPEGLFAIAVKKNNSFSELYYVETDHLGSVISLFSESGERVYTQSFDAWGRERNPQTWDYTPNPIPKPAWLIRGYTGHEMLPEFGLINMNGRMYDPVLGRMLSPDNFVQDATNTQSYNRYSYCWNNPLKYTDPDGEWLHIAIGAAIGGIVNLGVKAYQGKINSVGDGFAAFGIGAAAGAIGAATGGAAFAAAGGAAGGVGGFIAGAAGGAAGSAFATPVQSIGNSLYFGDPMMTAEQYLLNVGIGLFTGGIINGTMASFNGRSFWNGTIPRTQLPPIQPLQSLPAGPIENKVNNLELAKSEIKQAIPDYGPVNYKQEYIRKVTGVDGNHNWNRRTIEIVADNGKVFPNHLGADNKSQVLIQMVGDKYGTQGVFEIIIRDGNIVHQRFIPGGVVNGIPNQVVPGAPGGISPPFPWWSPIK